MVGQLAHLIPQIHVSTPYGFLNDPNGPVLLNGRLHLFFQYRTDVSERHPVVWGHVSSTDFVRWTHHRAAISPQPHTLDEDGVWSGNVIDDGGELIAFYSAFRSDRPYQSVLAARSADQGSSFSQGTLAVADPSPEEAVQEFRDPFVWHDGDRYFLAVGAAYRDGSAAVRFYESTDLETWVPREDRARRMRTVQTPPDSNVPIDTGRMWECPQVVSFDETDIVLVSRQAPEDTIGKVLSVTMAPAGAEDEREGLDGISIFDWGTNFYAASALRSGRDGAVVWGWVTEGRDADWAEEEGWSGMISLPRIVGLAGDGRLSGHAHPAVATLRAEQLEPRQVDGTLQILSPTAVFEAQVQIPPHGDRTVSIDVHASSSEVLRIGIDPAAGRVVVDRSQASDDPRAHRTSSVMEDPTLIDGGVLSVFVDGSVIEIFTPGGAMCTARFYPTSPPPWTVRVGGLDLAGLSSWRLDSGTKRTPRVHI